MIRKSDQVRDEEKDGRPCQDPQHLSHVQSAHMEEKSELPRERHVLSQPPPSSSGKKAGPLLHHRLLLCIQHAVFQAFEC